jgi:F-type H+-transporting ATPase subunit gamma
MSNVRLREVRRSILTTSQIRQVTNAMQKVASARLASDRKAAMTSRRYTERLAEVIADIAAELPDFTHPLTTPDRALSGRRSIIVFGSDRGLCGGYNSRILETLERFVGRDAVKDTALAVVGKVVGRRIRRFGLTIDRFFNLPARRTTPGPADSDTAPKTRSDLVRDLTTWATDSFLKDGVDEVFLLYTRFDSSLVQVPTIKRMLPLPLSETQVSGKPARKPGALATASFEPAPDIILGRLLPEFLRQMVDDAYLNSIASENAMRQAAMSRASENAGRMLGDLGQQYRRLRQESITTEMIELAGGRWENG